VLKLLSRRVAAGAAMVAVSGMMGGAVLVGAAPAIAAPPQAAADATRGKVVFAKCAICHAVEPGKNKLGPTLAGAVGRKPASVPGFNYSPAMKANAKPWTPTQLDLYLTNPRQTVPGTKMIFAGLPQPADRAAVIAYLSNPAAAK
jgi:cytochrome c